MSAQTPGWCAKRAHVLSSFNPPGTGHLKVGDFEPTSVSQQVWLVFSSYLRSIQCPPSEGLYRELPRSGGPRRLGQQNAALILARDATGFFCGESDFCRRKREGLSTVVDKVGLACRRSAESKSLFNSRDQNGTHVPGEILMDTLRSQTHAK